jgi:hypothetical protein
MKGARAPIRPRAFYIPIRRNVRVVDAQLGGALRFNQTYTPPTRYAGNPIINYGGGGWKDSQVQEPVVFVDPTDSTKLIMLFAAMASPVATGTQHIGIATATVADPYTWTESPANPWITDANRRIDSVFFDGTDVYMLSTNENPTSGIDLIKSTDLTYATANAGTATWSVLASPWIAPDGLVESKICQGAILTDGGVTYIAYAFRRPGVILPGISLRHFDGATWAFDSEIISLGGPGSPDEHFIEWHQLLKIGSKFVLTYEGYSGNDDTSPAGQLWTINMAVADAITGPWTKSPLNPVFTGNGVSAPDRWHVATPAWYQIGGTWYLFYQAGNLDPATNFYYNNNWSLCMAALQSGLTPLDVFNLGANATFQANKAAGGTLSFSGAIARFIGKSCGGVLNFVGSVARWAAKSLSGTLNFSGAIAKLATILKSLAGTLSFSGAVSTVVAVVKNLSGTLSFTGAISRRMNKALSGTLSFVGQALRLPIKICSGTLVASGALALQVRKSLAGMLGFLGDLVTRLFGEQVIAADKRADGTFTSSRTAGIAQTNVTDGKLTWEKNE